MPIQYLIVYRGIPHLWGLPGWLGSRRLGDHPQVVGDYPQPTQRSIPAVP
jgi:hypothetical protein